MGILPPRALQVNACWVEGKEEALGGGRIGLSEASADHQGSLKLGWPCRLSQLGVRRPGFSTPMLISQLMLAAPGVHDLVQASSLQRSKDRCGY